MATDSPTPEGWPPGYTILETVGAIRIEICDALWASSTRRGRERTEWLERMRPKAHAHYRTTREWRLEQLAREALDDPNLNHTLGWIDAARKELDAAR